MRLRYAHLSRAAVPPVPLAVACGFALYVLHDEDTTTCTHARAHTDTHAHTMRCELKSVVLDVRKGAAACGTVSVSVRQQEQALRHSTRRQMQRAHAMCQLYGLESYTWIVVT